MMINKLMCRKTTTSNASTSNNKEDRHGLPSRNRRGRTFVNPKLAIKTQHVGCEVYRGEMITGREGK